MKHPEFDLQCQIANYLELQYPNVLFYSDTIANIKLTMQQAVRNSKIQKKAFKMPDLIIFKGNSRYHGLMIELKVETPFKKDGTLKKSDHLEAQQKAIENLNELGYFACFSWGFDMTKKIIDDFMKIV